MDKDEKKKKKIRSRLCHCFGENEQKSVISQSIALLKTNSSGFSGWKDGLFLAGTGSEGTNMNSANESKPTADF